MNFPPKPAKKRIIYLDHAAATPVDPRVVTAMAPFWNKNFANPSALYSLGRANHEAVESARQTIADILYAHPECCTFTSGGTEANNLAIFGTVSRIRDYSEKIHIITTEVEHDSVLNPIQELEKQGVAVTYIPVNSRGEITVKDVIRSIRPETKLISIMYANNEIGTINPIAEIGRELLKYRQKNKTIYPYFHTDACQAAGTLELHTERLHVDLMTINGSKIYGPKGSGLLFVRRGVPIQPILFGGGQEHNLRSGTENVPGIVGLAKALELVRQNYAKEAERQTKLRDYFWTQLRKKIPDVVLNGPGLIPPSKRTGNGNTETKLRLPNNLNVRFAGLEAETLVLYLDAYGIIAATGSACASDSEQASHVLIACGLTATEAKSSVRFTLGKKTSTEHIAYILTYLPGIVRGIRAMQAI